MVEATEPHEQTINVWWLAAVGYAALAGFMWLFLGIRRLLQWRTYMAGAEAVEAQGNLEQAARIQAFAGSFIMDMGYAFLVALVCAFTIAALLRRSWNAWDYATVAVGFVAVLSLIFLCASDRIMFFIPLSMLPLLVLLYIPGVKAACGVRQAEQPTTQMEQGANMLTRPVEIEQEIAKEQALITELSQNLDVFEVERGMDTDTFVARYANGLEEETPDNAEWFSIARTVRRSRERIAELSTQLSIMSNGHPRE